MTEVEGKATGWSAYFDKGRWDITEKKAAAKPKSAAKKATAQKKA
jgi:DNA topoisomerase-1